MAKGDRKILKADTEDGYIKIADLLLEAMAMARLNGVQKGICLFLWRRTYGWMQKEDRISLKEFAQACDTSEHYVSRQLKQLIDWKVIIRTSYEPGKVPAYTFNTRVAQWDKGCLNVQGLSERAIQGLYICAIQGLHKRARVNQTSALEPQGLGPSLYTEDKQYINNSSSSKARVGSDPEKPQPGIEPEPDPGMARDVITVFTKEFGRLLSPMEIEQVNSWVKEFQEPIVLEALKRASLNGKPMVRYISGILTNWRKNNLRTLAAIKEWETNFKARGGTKGGQARAPDDKDSKKRAFIRSLYI